MIAFVRTITPYIGIAFLLILLLAPQYGFTQITGNPGGVAGPPGGVSAPPPTITPPLSTITVDPSKYLNDLYLWFLGFVGISALFGIVVGGVLYMFSGTSITKVDEAKKWITNALFGLVIAGGSYILLSIINPDLIRGFDVTQVIQDAINKTMAPPITNTPCQISDSC